MEPSVARQWVDYLSFFIREAVFSLLSSKCVFGRLCNRQDVWNNTFFISNEMYSVWCVFSEYSDAPCIWNVGLAWKTLMVEKTKLSVLYTALWSIFVTATFLKVSFESDTCWSCMRVTAFSLCLLCIYSSFFSFIKQLSEPTYGKIGISA